MASWSDDDEAREAIMHLAAAMTVMLSRMDLPETHRKNADDHIFSAIRIAERIDRPVGKAKPEGESE